MLKYDVIAAHAAKRPAAPAIISGERRISWSEMADQVARAATGLSELISAKTDTAHVRAAFISENRWEIPILQGAAGSIGLPVVGIDDSLPVAHVAACLRQLQPTVLVVSPSRYDLVCEALLSLDLGASSTRRPSVVLLPGQDDGLAGGAQALYWAELVKADADRARWLSLPFEGLGFTSGTTNAPKLVIRSKSFDAQRTPDVTEFFGISQHDVYLNTVPLYHASGPGWAKIFAAHGAPVVLAPYNDPPAMLAALERERVTATLMVPPVLESLVSYMEKDRTSPPNLDLRFIVTGGRHVSPSLVRRTRRMFGDVLHVYYGTTETGLNTLTARDEINSVPGSVGTQFPGNRIFILDREHRPMSAGRKGRIAVSGYMLADKYAASDAPVAEIDGEIAWLTPDMGWLDAGGRLHIAARDLPPAASHLDIVTLEGQLRDSLDIEDLAILLDVRDGKPLMTVAYVCGDRTALGAQDIAAEASRHADGIDVHAFQMARIPYSPTGKIRPQALHALIGNAGSSMAHQPNVRVTV